MERIIEDIKQTLRRGSSADIGASVKQWTEDLKQRGISIAVLEELLHFYATPHHATTDTTDVGFYLASEVEQIDDGQEKKLKALRDERDCLMQDCRRTEQSAAAMRMQRNVAIAAAVVLFVAGLVVGLVV